MAILCEGYPGDQIARDNFVDMQRAIGRLVDGLPEEGVTHRLVDSYWGKVAAIMVYQDSDTKEWLESQTPTMEAWEGSRFNIVLFPHTREWRPGFRAPWRTRSGFSYGSVG